MPAPAGPTVQMFGLVDSRPTQAALRFFKERRVPYQLIDVAQKGPSAGELRKIAPSAA